MKQYTIDAETTVNTEPLEEFGKTSRLNDVAFDSVYEAKIFFKTMLEAWEDIPGCACIIATISENDVTEYNELENKKTVCAWDCLARKWV